MKMETEAAAPSPPIPHIEMSHPQGGEELEAGDSPGLGRLTAVADPLFVAGNADRYDPFYLRVPGASLVNHIAEARLHSLQFKDLLPTVCSPPQCTAI
jgi:hypothetical protein